MANPPEIPPEDASAWSVFWLCRNATPADQPLDLEKVLRLHDRLYGPGRDMCLVTLLSAMDGAFLETRSSQLRSQVDSGSRGKK